VRAVIVGTGRVGCGFVAPALRAAGYDVVFVGRNAAVVEHLVRLGRYRVRLIQGRGAEELAVEGIGAIHSCDADAVAREVASADLVATAVGAESLRDAALLLAPGLLQRCRPVNVLAFENLVQAGPRLRALVAENVPFGDRMQAHGFAGALPTRVIAERLGDPLGDEPISFIGDPPARFFVEAARLGPPLPAIPGMMLADDYAACSRRKLYVFGAGHATAAYLGYLKGYRYVHSAVRDAEIREATLGAMAEGRAGVVTRYGLDEAAGPGAPEAILARFENAALCDAVCRVGRDPGRKLAHDDRLVGAARLAEEAGERAENLALAIAAAFYFQSPGDPSAVDLRSRLQTLGVRATLESVCGLHGREPLTERVEKAWAGLTPGSRPENFLLYLRSRAWAAERGRAGLSTGSFHRAAVGVGR
jgi:mannitol-1-phosphate 5-dehydrogenase